MVVSLKTDLRFPIPGQQGHEGRIIHCVPGMCGGHQDYVTTRDGKVIGLSSSAVYSSHYHKMISECTIDMEYAKECEEVIVKWGDYGKRIKDIRAVIAKFPLNDLVENKNYDISSCPYGFEE